jgi:hypothetical protein
MIKAQRVKLARKDIQDGFPERDVLKKYDLKAKDLIKKDKKNIPGFKVERNKTEPDKTELDKTEPDKTEPDKTEPDKTEPDKTEPDKTEPETIIDPKLSVLFSEDEKSEKEDAFGDDVDSSGLELLFQDKEMIYEMLDFYITDILKSDKPVTKGQKKILGILVPRIAEKRLSGKSFQYLDEIILLIVLSSITLPRIDWKKINSLKGK